MALVFCTSCGTHDVCPMDLFGEQMSKCDTCGQLTINACGECSACNDYYDVSDGDTDFDDDDFDDDENY